MTFSPAPSYLSTRMKELMISAIAVIESDIFFFQVTNTIEIRVDTEEIFFVSVSVHIKSKMAVFTGGSRVVDVVLIFQKNPAVIF